MISDMRFRNSSRKRGIYDPWFSLTYFCSYYSTSNDSSKLGVRIFASQTGKLCRRPSAHLASLTRIWYFEYDYKILQIRDRAYENSTSKWHVARAGREMHIMQNFLVGTLNRQSWFKISRHLFGRMPPSSPASIFECLFSKVKQSL